MVYLAHELGHALADDIQQENGRSFRDYSWDEQEQQAYFVQHIVSRHLTETLGHDELSSQDVGDDVLKMSWERAAQYSTAGQVFDSALQQGTDTRRHTITYALDQRSF